MASDKQPPVDSFLAAVEAKIAAWKAVADSYRNAVSLDGPVGDGNIVVSAVGSSAGGSHVQGHGRTIRDLPVGVFRDKTIKDAIVIYLEAGRRKQTNKEIADGLKKGGIATTSENFEPTVATALYRLKNEGVLLRFEDGWDLAASYPDSLKSRLENQEKKPKSKKKKRTKTITRKQIAAVSDAQKLNS